MERTKWKGLFGHGDSSQFSPSIAGLVQPELPKQSQEIRPLQADRPGGARAVAVVRRQHLD